jgi:5-methylcytosine-specific restriction protein A
MGKLVAAYHVDHIIPIESGGDERDHGNLQSLCHSCHSQKTNTDQGGTQRNWFDDNGNPINPNHHWNRRH